MTTKKKKTKYECLGGPLCGRMESGLKSELGIPCFAYTDDDNRKHFYRLARTKAGVKYWHYLGMLGLDKSIKPCLRPSPHDA
jgi:hypothetical protein